uniref:ATP-dependent DNA helicase n=1 Tax=Octopus bimaculoides TaxID=37653 RepID=A0A0L8GIS7_OCTBM
MGEKLGARLIVWDKALTCHRYLFEALNRILKDIMNTNLILGGKLIIQGGDFRQILSVVQRAQRPSLIGTCLKKSIIWHECEVLHLTTHMRVQNCLSSNDTTSQAQLAYHSVWLLQIGDGRIPNVQRQLYDDLIEIPQQVHINSKEDLITHIYEDLEVNCNNAQWLSL